MTEDERRSVDNLFEGAPMLRRLLAVLVAAPLFAVAASAQTATTVCKDGTTTATTGRGACTGHGGVDKNAAKKAAAAAKAEQKSASKAPAATAPAAAPRPAASAVAPTTAAPMRPAPAARAAAPTTSTTHAANTDPTGATAQCKDGTYSHAASHRGACARHQGVAKWL